MGSEERIDWQAVRDADFGVPAGRPLADVTAELTTLLGDPDPHRRDGIALTVLQTWIERGVYDDLLVGLGDGMVTGLRVGLDRRRRSTGPGAGPAAETMTGVTAGVGEGDGVFRRSFSALVLAECVARDTARPLVLGATVLGWADALAAWWLAETDLRGWVTGKGWAHAVAHGADAVATLARSPHFAASELQVLLDVLAQRVTTSTDRLFVSGEPDRLASATIEVLRRDRVPVEDVEVWLAALATAGREARGARGPGAQGRDPYLATGNLEAYLRALYLQLALGPRPPRTRADVLLALVEALRELSPAFLGLPAPPAAG